MSQFKCTICGYIYDESVGVSEKGIKPGTKWEELSEDFLCPLCGAPKSAFEALGEIKEAVSKIRIKVEEEPIEKLSEFSHGELRAVFSNLAKGCEKQNLIEEIELFNQLENYYNNRDNTINESTLDSIENLLEFDLKEGYLTATSVSEKESDRGALRAIVWNEKVSRMIKSLLSRYAKNGASILENTKIYVCDICGFVYLGDEAPKLCPVCKVPNFKITEVKRG